VHRITNPEVDGVITSPFIVTTEIAARYAAGVRQKAQ
jgi:hypothetical protein